MTILMINIISIAGLFSVLVSQVYEEDKFYPASDINPIPLENTSTDLISEVSAEDTIVYEPEDENKSALLEIPSPLEFTYPIYKYTEVELPLVQNDYYWGKYVNASVAASEVNTIGELAPGDNRSLLNDGIITLEEDAGYIKPASGYYFASGVCWTSTTLGYLMDEANAKFIAEYNMPLFVFSTNDRLPHKVTYPTYKNVNSGYGYSITKNGDYYFDYIFQINPALANDPVLKDLRAKIVMTPKNDNPAGFNNESIGAYLLTNLENDKLVVGD